MEIKSNKINSANAEITATISIDEVNVNIEKIAKQLAKTTTVQGFRKGKVPVSIVKQQYGRKLVEDAKAKWPGELQNSIRVNFSMDESNQVADMVSQLEATEP